MLGYDMNKVFEMTIDAMRSCEESVRNELEELNY